MRELWFAAMVLAVGLTAPAQAQCPPPGCMAPPPPPGPGGPPPPPPGGFLPPVHLVPGGWYPPPPGHFPPPLGHGPVYLQWRSGLPTPPVVTTPMEPPAAPPYAPPPPPSLGPAYGSYDLGHPAVQRYAPAPRKLQPGSCPAVKRGLEQFGYSQVRPVDCKGTAYRYLARRGVARVAITFQRASGKITVTPR